MKRKNITFTMDPQVVDLFKKYCDKYGYVPSRKLELMVLDLLKEEDDQEGYVAALLSGKKFSGIGSLIKELMDKKAIINIDFEDLVMLLQSGSKYEVRSGSFDNLFSNGVLGKRKKYVSVLVVLECPSKFYLKDAQILLDKVTKKFDAYDLNFIYAAKTNYELKKPNINLLLVS